MSLNFNVLVVCRVWKYAWGLYLTCVLHKCKNTSTKAEGPLLTVAQWQLCLQSHCTLYCAVMTSQQLLAEQSLNCAIEYDRLRHPTAGHHSAWKVFVPAESLCCPNSAQNSAMFIVVRVDADVQPRGDEPSDFLLSILTSSTVGPLTLILRRSRTGTVWFNTSTSNNTAARPKLYTESLTRDLKLRPATSWAVHYTTSCNTQSSAPEDG